MIAHGQHPRARVLPSPVTHRVSAFEPLVTMIFIEVTVPVIKPRESNVTIVSVTVGVAAVVSVAPKRWKTLIVGPSCTFVPDESPSTLIVLPLRTRYDFRLR